MDLQEFVRETLLQICRGVGEAQSLPSGSIINPKMRVSRIKDENTGQFYTRIATEDLKDSGLMPTNYTESVATMFEFDIAVTVDSKQTSSIEGEGKAEGSAKIYVANASVDLHGKAGRTSEAGESRVSRIKFSIPVQFHGK